MSVLNFQLFIGRKLLASNSTHSPMGDEHSGRSRAYVVEDFLNSGVAIILAAMLCALICVVALGSLFRWARRRIREVGAGSSDEVIVRLADTGLRNAAMETLPIVVYTSPSKLPPVSATDCPICLSEFVEGEKLRVLHNCNHSFHMECIDEWLASQSSCPICRHSLNLPSRNEKSGGAAIGRGTESNNAIHVVIETTDSTPIPPRTESLENLS